MTVEENLELGAFLRKDKAGIHQDLQKVMKFFRDCMNDVNNHLEHFLAENNRC